MAPRLSAYLKSPGEDRSDSTAKRKRALLESFRDTLRNQEIAERLKVSVSTVKACLRELYEGHTVRDHVVCCWPPVEPAQRRFTAGLTHSHHKPLLVDSYAVDGDHPEVRSGHIKIDHKPQWIQAKGFGYVLGCGAIVAREPEQVTR